MTFNNVPNISFVLILIVNYNFLAFCEGKSLYLAHIIVHKL